MSASFTLKFDTWAPDLQNVALEVDGSSAAVPCADVLNVYYQDAAFRCLPGLNPYAPSLGEQALTLLSGYDNIIGNNYVYAGGTNDIQILQNGVWSSVPIEPTSIVTLTGLQMGFTQGGSSTGANTKIVGKSMRLFTGAVNARGGLLLNATLLAGATTVNTGYNRGSFGTLTPAVTPAGVTVVTLTNNTAGGPGSPNTLLILSGTLPKNYFTTLSCPTLNRTLSSNTANYSLVSGNTQWQWAGSSLGMFTGNSYNVRLIA